MSSSPPADPKFPHPAPRLNDRRKLMDYCGWCTRLLDAFDRVFLQEKSGSKSTGIGLVQRRSAARLPFHDLSTAPD